MTIAIPAKVGGKTQVKSRDESNLTLAAPAIWEKKYPVKTEARGAEGGRILAQLRFGSNC